MTSLAHLIGTVFDNTYCIDKQLGQGGMGAVFRATHLGTERPVALKVISPSLMNNREFVERFKREAKAAGRLRHPNVVNVTDFGFAEVGSTQVAYLVMEYLDGCTLGEFLRKQQRLPLNFVIDLVEQTCLAMEKAHQLGIIHRDLKPENIWLEPNGRGGYNVKVLDFGLAKLRGPGDVDQPTGEYAPHKSLPVLNDQTVEFSTLNLAQTIANVDPSAPTVADHTKVLGGSSDGQLATETLQQRPTKGLPQPQTVVEELTQVGAIMGTPLYMSPEQSLGERVDTHTDIYSLGVIVYEMLAGESPFAGSLNALMEQHAKISPPSLQEKRPDIPPLVADLVMSALAKNPAERPISAAAFAQAMRARAESVGLVLRRAFGLYIEHFPIFIRLSLLGNIPTIVIGVFLLVLIPFIHLTAPILGIFFILLGLALHFSFTANRAAFIFVVEQVLKSPLSPIEFKATYQTLKQKLELSESTNSVNRYIQYFFKILKLEFSFTFQTSNVLCVPIAIYEGKKGAAAVARSKFLTCQLPHLLKGIEHFAIYLYLIPIILFFCSAFGISKALGLATAASLTISFLVAFIVVTINALWILPPIPTALALLYFRACQAGGETLEKGLG